MEKDTHAHTHTHVTKRSLTIKGGEGHTRAHTHTHTHTHVTKRSLTLKGGEDFRMVAWDVFLRWMRK